MNKKIILILEIIVISLMLIYTYNRYLALEKVAKDNSTNINETFNIRRYDFYISNIEFTPKIKEEKRIIEVIKTEKPIKLIKRLEEEKEKEEKIVEKIKKEENKNNKKIDKEKEKIEDIVNKALKGK